MRNDSEHAVGECVCQHSQVLQLAHSLLGPNEL